MRGILQPIPGVQLQPTIDAGRRREVLSVEFQQLHYKSPVATSSLLIVGANGVTYVVLAIGSGNIAADTRSCGSFHKRDNVDVRDASQQLCRC